MQIVIDKPPNFEEIDKKFNIASKGVIFAYGNKIYNPENIVISPELITHELTHGHRQGASPDKWWKLYLTIPMFRLEEEFYAHHSELIAFKVNHKDRNEHARYLHSVALRLSSPLYGNLISYLDAVRSLKYGRIVGLSGSS